MCEFFVAMVTDGMGTSAFTLCENAFYFHVGSKSAIMVWV